MDPARPVAGRARPPGGSRGAPPADRSGTRRIRERWPAQPWL